MKKLCSILLVISIIISCMGIVSVSAASGQDIVNEARKWIGTPYGHSDGSGGPGTVVDCSGLTLQVYKKFGYTLDWSTYSQIKQGSSVSFTQGNYSNLQLGDLLFMYNTGHVGIYSGNGKVIHASSGSYGKVVEVNIWDNGKDINAVRRIISNGNQPTSSTSNICKISNTNQVIRYGNSGSAVSELQTCLNKAINAGLAVDGKFGDATLKAVKNFQSKYGLTVDGDAGPKTLTKLNEVLSGNTTSITASIPTNTKVDTNGTSVTVTWSKSANATKYDVYLVSSPWGWEDIKYSGSTTNASYTFNNVAEGSYAAFVIARPNSNNQAQSKWFWFDLEAPHVHSFETKYDSKHPHREYKDCLTCDVTEYTGNVKKSSSCEECYPHEHDYAMEYESKHPHKQYKICEDCGEREYTGDTREMSNCDECNICIHSYITKHDSIHPHKTYKKCSVCGDIVYTGNTNKVETCKVCYPVSETKRTIKLQIGIPDMTIDGNVSEIDPGRGTSPILQNSRTLLPIRAICESFGASVVWNQLENKVTVYRDDTAIEMWIDNTKAYVNGDVRYLDVAPVLINSRTFMPIRFIAESLGLTVGWDNDNWTVTIEGSL